MSALYGLGKRDRKGFEMSRYDDYDYDEDCGCDFAEPGSNSALRAASKNNPRNLPCSTCHYPNRLTPNDVALGYQCNSCANAMENGGEIDYYEDQ
jgi:hypothetical protein